MMEQLGFFESVRLLRSPDPDMSVITNPSADVVADLDEIIQRLREDQANETASHPSTTTRFELAVALLWHSNTSLIKEGLLLMLALLQELWELRWCAAVGSGARGHDEEREKDVDAASHMVDSVSCDDNDDNNQPTPHRFEGGTVDVLRGVGPHSRACTGATGQPLAFSSGEKFVQPILRGTTVQFATAPPPPEDEQNSVLPSLVRHRNPSNGVSQDALPQFLNSTTSTAPAAHQAGSTNLSSSSSYTGPSSLPSNVAREIFSEADLCRSDAQLAECYYHLAVGCTKLGDHKKALFYIHRMLELHPLNAEVLALQRFLNARLKVESTIKRTLSFLPFLWVAL